jgi:hypothetical protein
VTPTESRARSAAPHYLGTRIAARYAKGDEHMRLAEVQSRLAEAPARLSELSERYQVPERISAASQKAYEGMSAASEAARRGAHAAYQIAREYPRASVASALVAAALIGGALWYLFGDPKRPVERRRRGARVRSVSERRRRHARARA